MIPGPAVRSFNPIWSFVDLNGKQCDDTFYLWVLQNQIPYAPAVVWHDPAMTIPWTSPIQLLANGTLPVDVYWDPNQVYRLELRQNILPPPSQSDPLIYLVQNYIPNGNNPFNPQVTGIYTDNQITNPQFAALNIPTTLTLTNVTNPASLEIGPGWFLEGLVGTGNVTITQVPLNNAIPTPTNAPYALHLVISGGFTGTPILRQRFQQNGVNWANKFVSGSITAMINGVAQMISTRLDASNGAPIAFIIQTPLLTNNFVEYKGVSQLPATINPDVPPNAGLDYKILLSNNIDIYITSVQLIASDNSNEFEYEETTIDRQLDYTFHYAQPSLNYKMTESYLKGWDFPFNPAQFNGDTILHTNPIMNTGPDKGLYLWDQTILFQTVTSSVDVARAANGGLQLTCNTNGQIALIQYLDQITARKILRDRASVHIDASTTHANGLIGNVTLWATTDGTLPVVAGGTNNTLITTIGATGIPTALSSANWVQIPNLYKNTQFTLQAASGINAESADIYLNGWDMQNAAPTNTATFFAIVVGFSPWIATDIVTINSISLCPGNIATRPLPKSYAQTLLDCQRFYWKTFNPGVVPATAVGLNTGEIRYSAIQANVGNNYSQSIFFPAILRAIPNMTYYNPVSANANAYDITQAADGGVADNTGCNLSVGSFNIHVPTVGGTASGDRLAVHAVADARLGIV